MDEGASGFLTAHCFEVVFGGGDCLFFDRAERFPKDVSSERYGDGEEGDGYGEGGNGNSDGRCLVFGGLDIWIGCRLWH